MTFEDIAQNAGAVIRAALPGESWGEPYTGFIRPLRYKNKMYLYGVNTKIGYNSEGYYLYLGPPNPDLTAAQGMRLLCAGEQYSVDRAEKVLFGDEVFYIWAVVRTVVDSE